MLLFIWIKCKHLKKEHSPYPISNRLILYPFNNLIFIQNEWCKCRPSFTLTWDRYNRYRHFHLRRHRTFVERVETRDQTAMRLSLVAWPVLDLSPCHHTDTACCLDHNSNLLKINIYIVL